MHTFVVVVVIVVVICFSFVVAVVVWLGLTSMYSKDPFY